MTSRKSLGQIMGWALLGLAVSIIAACSGGGKGGDEMLTISVSVPPEIGGVVKLKDGRASVLFNSAVIAQDLAIEIGEEPGSGQATLKIEFPARLLAAYSPVKSPRRQTEGADAPASEEGAGEEAAALPTSGTLGINVTEPGGVLLMAISGSIDFSGSSPIVVMNSDGIVYVDSDGDGAPNWLEVFLNTDALSASEAPPQEAIDGAIGSLTETFTTSVASGDTTTGGVSGSDVPVTGDGTTGTDSTTGGATTPAGGEPNTTLTAKPSPFTKVNTAQFKFGTDTGAKFQCALDLAGFADCNSPVNYSSLAEGRHTFKVRAVSADGTADSTPASYTWTVDTIVPTLTIEGLPVVVVNVTTQTATFVCSEADCAYLCGLDGASPAGCSSPYTINTLADGEHTLAVKAVDQAGNESSPASSATFTIDTTPPAKPDAAKVTVTSNAVGTADQVKSAAAGVEGGTTVKVYSDGLLTDKLAETTAKADGSFDAVNIGDNKGDSSDKVHVVAIDAAGNMSPVLSLTNDKTPPAAGTISLKDQTIGSTAYTNAVAVDAVLTGPADAAAWFLTEGAAPAATASGWVSTMPTTFAVSTSDGAKTVNLYIKDAAHNMSPVASASITLDTALPANPTLALKDADCPSCSATNAVGINVTVGNDTSDVAQWLIREGQSAAPVEGDAGWGTEPTVFTLSSGDASKDVYIWVKDAAGNMNSTAVLTSITLDAVLPTVGTVATSSTEATCGTGPYTCVDSPFTISAPLTDSGSGVASCEYSTDGGGTWTVGTVTGGNCTTSAATCAEVQNTPTFNVNVRVTDNAGNSNTGTPVARRCDAQGPTFGGLTSATATSTTAITLNWTAGSDTASAVGDLVYDICQSTVYNDCANNFTATYTSNAGVTTYNVTSLTQGTRYFFVARAKDPVGHVETNTVEKSAITNTYRVSQVMGGTQYTCVLLADGTVQCLGSNANGRLGDGSSTDRTTLAAVSSLTSVVAMDMAWSSACAITGGGQVSCWGENQYGQLGVGDQTERKVPTAVPNIVATAVSGGTTSCFVGSSPGNGWFCTGYNVEGNIGDNTSVNKSTAVGIGGLSAGQTSFGYANCAIDSGNHLTKCWGGGNQGQIGDGTSANKYTPTVVSTNVYARAIGSGSGTACAVLTSGQVKCWGSGPNGSVGDGASIHRSVPVAVSTLTNALAVDRGNSFGCALIADGTVNCWGWNDSGRVGDGTSTDRWVPVAVSSLSGVVQIGVGQSHSCVVVADGSIKCWGTNTKGELLDGTTTSSSVPVAVATVVGAPGIIAPRVYRANQRGPSALPFPEGLVAGAGFSCGLVSDRKVRCWGANTSGQIGDGTTANRIVGNAVSSLTGVMDLAAGGSHACALVAGGTVKCWGSNSNGQVGDTTVVNRSTPTAVTSLSNVLTIQAGTSHSCSILVDGSVKCWGKNTLGQLGDGTTNDRSTPIAVSTLTSVVALTVGGQHACAYDASGTKTVTCWGSNSSGQLGDNTTTDRSVPMAVSSLTHTNVYQVSAGGSHTCVRYYTGTAKCWGSNASGQLGDGTTLDKAYPVAVTSLTTGVIMVSAGSAHACALMADGTAECWGNNTSGELGDGTSTSSSIPVVVTSLTNVVAIAPGLDAGSGLAHTCALIANGTVKCWGANASGQVGDGTTVNKTTPTAALYLP